MPPEHAGLPVNLSVYAAADTQVPGPIVHGFHSFPQKMHRLCALWVVAARE